MRIFGAGLKYLLNGLIGSKTAGSMRENQQNNGLKYTRIGFQMLVTIGLGVWMGVWLDEKTNLDFPLFTILFSLLFIFASIYNVIRQLPKQ